MRYINHILLTFLFCVFTSCTDKSTTSWINDIPDENIRNLSFQEMGIKPLVGKPYQIEVAGDLLAVADDIDGKALLLYNLKDASYVRTLHIGQGPEEVITPIEIIMTNNDSTLHVFQRRSGKYRKYNLTDFFTGRVHAKNEISLEGADRFTTLTDGYASLGFYEKGVLATFNDYGKIIRYTDLYPDIPIENIGSKYKMQQGRLAFNELTDYLMYAPSFASYILFYQRDKEGNWTKQSSFRVGDERLEQKTKKKDMVLRNDDIQNCIDACSTSRYFYVLYSGNNLGKTEMPKERYIIRFTSNGRFDRLYKINSTVKNICVTEDDSGIFALMIGKDNEYAIGKGYL